MATDSPSSRVQVTSLGEGCAFVSIPNDITRSDLNDDDRAIFRAFIAKVNADPGSIGPDDLEAIEVSHEKHMRVLRRFLRLGAAKGSGGDALHGMAYEARGDTQVTVKIKDVPSRALIFLAEPDPDKRASCLKRWRKQLAETAAEGASDDVPEKNKPGRKRKRVSAKEVDVEVENVV